MDGGRSSDRLLRRTRCCPRHRRPEQSDPCPAVEPGIGIGTYNADSTPGSGCTAGWLVHGADGQAGLLTAGHCFHGGGATYLNTTQGFVGIGRFIHHVYDGDGGDDADMAELGISNYPGAPSVDTDTRIIGIRPVVAPSTMRGWPTARSCATTGRPVGHPTTDQNAVALSTLRRAKCDSSQKASPATLATRSTTAMPTAPPHRSASLSAALTVTTAPSLS